jgi:glycosyltransferase involved in cell wall biosynthesis
MRVLHVVPTYAPAWRYGGPIRSVHALCRALVQRGHEVHVYTTNMDGPGNLDVPVEVPIDRDGVNVWYFPAVVRSLNMSPLMGRHLRKTIKSFDVVHLHSIFLWPTLAAARQCSRQGVPYIVAPRGMLVRDLFERKRTLIKWLWFYLCERSTLQRAAAIHATSQLEEEEARKFPVEFQRFAIIPNGVDMPADGEEGPAKAKCHETPRDRYILFIGRINWKKGLDRLIRSLAWVRDDVNVVVAGNDEDGYRAKVEQLAAHLGLTQRVFFVGAVDGAEKEKWLRDATVLALPSYSENFGNVILEAMASRCPVVVTPEVGLAAVVEEARSGIVADGEPTRLADAFERILANPDLAADMGKRGQAVVRENFCWPAIAKQMENLYQELQVLPTVPQ